MRELFLLIIFLISTYQIAAQSRVQFENIGVQEGLSTIHVNQIIQDKKQFIWIATANGLNRFDGIDFKTFKNEDDIPHSISGDNIRCVLEDSRGYIWAGTLNSGLNRYNYQTGKFTRFFFDEKDKTSISSNEILSLFEDSKGRLWVGTERGLNLFDHETQTFTQFLPNSKKENTLSARAVLTIAEDHRGWIWLGTWSGGLNLMIPTSNPKVFEFRHFKRGEKTTDLIENHIWKIFLDKDNRLWCGTYSGGLSVMLPSTINDPKKFTPTFQTFANSKGDKSILSDIIFGLNQDKNGTIWVATVDGLSLVKPIKKEDNTIELLKQGHFQNNFMNNRSLMNNEMRDIFIDKNGLVWCSTVGGISKFDQNNAYFKHFFPVNNEGQDILVHSLFSYENDFVYIASRAEYGLIEYNQKTNTYKNYHLKTASNIQLAPISFYKTDDGEIWIGTHLGIGKFNPITKAFVHYELKHPNEEYFINLQVRKIFKVDKNKLWLATGAGLAIFHTEKKTFNFLEKDVNGKSFPKLDVNDLLFNRNTLWLATYSGLTRIDFEDNGEFEFKIYKNETDNDKSICSNRAISLAKVDGEIWIGTEKGLSYYNTYTDDFKNFSTKDGLKNPNIIALLSVNNKQLWLATRSGLAVLNPKTERFVYYDEKDGIQLGSFSQNAVASDENQQLYFGGTNGYIQFDAKEIQKNRYVPPIYITGFNVFNKALALENDIAITKTITLQPGQNYFTIDFAALNFTQSSDNMYAYKLEGFNDDWIECGTQKSVSFSNLDGGKYTFRVKAMNNDGIWNEEGIQLEIVVIPPFWQRTWFKIMLILLLCGLPFLMYYSRLNSIQRQKEKLENQVKVRTEEIQHQNIQIENLVKELQVQNNQLEETVKQRTETLERSNLELIRSNKDLEQFAYVASHDLQEPLRTIGSFTQLLQRRYKDNIDAEGQMYINKSIDGVKRMSALIKNLLNYSRLGRSDVEFRSQALLSIVEEKVEDLSLKIQEKQAKIIIKELPENVVCEPNQIGIVFYNLINNAIKFNRSEVPKVIVKLYQENDNYYTFAVADNGIGINKNYKSKVFEIFHRLNNKKDFEGNGIGLAFCKKIIERHEGKIWFESELGIGTTFYFTVYKHLSNQKHSQLKKRR
ncbi:MAG: two-component regulator propeller domain-containing protein [Saprospiraceae bacterium]